mgnify:CR=1 FL=1
MTEGKNVESLLRRAKKARAVAATNCNERSSRSHSVFILKIQGSNAKTGENCVGSLNLVDLAGSERLKDSGSTGQRLEETKNINTSLSNLSKVILALGNKVNFYLTFNDIAKILIVVVLDLSIRINERLLLSGWSYSLQGLKINSSPHEFTWRQL